MGAQDFNCTPTFTKNGDFHTQTLYFGKKTAPAGYNCPHCHEATDFRCWRSLAVGSFSKNLKLTVCDIIGVTKSHHSMGYLFWQTPQACLLLHSARWLQRRITNYRLSIRQHLFLCFALHWNSLFCTQLCNKRCVMCWHVQVDLFASVIVSEMPA